MNPSHSLAQRLAELRRADADLDLLEGAFIIALSEYPDLDATHYRSRIDAWADELNARLPPDAGVETRLRQLNHFLFEQQGFSGDVEDYYNPDNSCINAVMDRKRGIPITLSLLYIELGRRIGLPLEGVSYPGHFLVKLHIGEGAVVLDPFHRGASLDEEDLSALLLSLFNLNEKDPTRHLHSASTADILARMLRNLRQIHQQNQEPLRLLTTLDLLLAMEPHDPELRRDRALTLIELECAQLAEDDLRFYLDERPEADDAALLQQQLSALSQQTDDARILH